MRGRIALSVFTNVARPLIRRGVAAPPATILLGFAALPNRAIRAGVERLAAALAPAGRLRAARSTARQP